MELYQLEYFIKIAEVGTISKAAEQLHISQPALTRSIQKLEDEFELTLFNRTKNRLSLNENGYYVLDFARKLVNDKNTMLTSIEHYKQSKETIFIGSCAPAPLWGIKQILKNTFPQKKLTSFISDNQTSLIEKLKTDEISLLILNQPLHDKNIISKDLFTETLYVALNKDDPLTQYKSLTFEQLNGSNILVLSKTGYWSKICDEKLNHSLFLAQEDIEAYKALNQASTLPTFRTNITIQKFKNTEDKIYLPITDKEATLTFYIIYKKENKNLFDSLENHVSKIPWNEYRNEDNL